jgi:hypothetical protein
MSAGIVRGGSAGEYSIGARTGQFIGPGGWRPMVRLDTFGASLQNPVSAAPLPR